MKILFILLVISCTTIPEPIPEPEPTPIPEPTPEPIPPPTDVRLPRQVVSRESFVVWHCGLLFERMVRVLWEAKYPAGGFMGWDSATQCKRQTMSVNTAGDRWFQFEVDGQLQPEKFALRVLPVQ